MKVGISSNLLAHYAAEATTLAMCWKITRTDSTVLGFTAHDADIVFDGVTYEAAIGFSPSATETQTKLAVDNLEVIGVIDSDTIDPADLLAGVWDFALVEVFLVNWADTSMGRDVLSKGRLGKIIVNVGTYSAELRGLADAYSAAIGEVYQPTCRAQLGDSRCGVDLTSSSDTDLLLTVVGVIDDVSDNGLVIFDAARTEPGPTGGKAITGITNATLPVVTCIGHGFAVNSVVYIAGVSGMAEINGWHYVVKTVPSIDTFTLLSTDSTTWGVYTSGGTAIPQGDSGHFDFGKITMLDGASAGLSMEVKAYSPGTITLQLQFPHGVGVGDSYEMVAGCGKRFAEDCVARFNNGINFRGEPHVPGMDRLIWVGGQER